MTEKFVTAAELMAKTLGAPDHRFATIPHPISSADFGQLSSAAKTTAATCAQLLTTAN